MATEIVKTELNGEGTIELPPDPEPGGRIRQGVRALLRFLHLKEPQQPNILNLFQSNMSAYRFVSRGGAVAIVPFHNDLLDDSKVPLEAICRRIALPELEAKERTADRQTAIVGYIKRDPGGSDDYPSAA